MSSSSIKRLLNQHYIRSEDNVHDKNKKEIYFTHVSMISPKGKFYFSNFAMDSFWEEYCELIQNNDNTISGIAERPKEYIPVLGDIDIKINESSDINYGNHLYTEEQVKAVIEIYQNVMRDILENCEEQNLTCVLLEKPIYKISKNNTIFVKNGFHLHFPYTFMHSSDYNVHLIPRVKQIVKELAIFENLGIQDSSAVVDPCLKTPWLLYGSRKMEDMDPYLFSKVFNSNCEEVDLEEAFANFKCFNSSNQRIHIAGNIRKYLPMILSINPIRENEDDGEKANTKIIKRGTEIPMKKIKKAKEDEEKRSGKKRVNISNEENLISAAKLLPLLAQFRSEDRNEWISIGWALYNIGNGCSQALELWLEFSSRSSSYNEAVCVDEWEKMEKRNLTIGTLRYFASVDNPELYKQLKKDETDNYVKESLNGSHNDVAKVLFSEYENEFVCTGIQNKIWYQFINHKWEEIEEGVFLREKISSEIVSKYVEIGKTLFEKLSGVSDKAEEVMYNARLKNVRTLITNLKSATYKNSIMKECSEVFYDRTFKNKLDSNPYLICFVNGVYDLKESFFRPGRPEDYISKSMPINYREFEEWDDRVFQVHDYLEKVFPDTSLRRYFLDHASDIFVGGNHRKVVLFWTGEGDNAKSVTQGIFEQMLGELAIKFSTTLVTGKKTNIGTANPELARAGGTRWAVLEEPDGDEQINIGILKSLSGNDSYWARDLFEKGKATKEIKPMFKLIFICNKLPKMKYSDKATWNRIRVIPFESTFVRPGEPCPESYEEQLRQKRFPMDSEFSNKIPFLLEPFAWILLNHRKNVFYGSEEPEKVKTATNQYIQQNDIYKQYIDENIVIVEDEKCILALAEVYLDFKGWYKESYPGFQIPIKSEFKQYLLKNWKQPKAGCRWAGYKILNIDDRTTSYVSPPVGTNLNDYEPEGKAFPPI